MAETEFDPFVPGEAQRAWPRLATMRAECPVAEIAGGMQYVTRHEGCRAVMRDVTSFSNASGMKAPGVDVPLLDRVLGELDAPQHTAIRRVVVTALTPKVVHAAEPFMRETARDLLDAITPGDADLVPDFTVPLPNRITVHLLGLPAEDASQIAVWAKELMVSGFPLTNQGPGGEGFSAGFPEFAGYIDAAIAQRLADPRDDIVTRLATMEIDGARLEHRQVRALVRNLITGGLTTTSQLLGNLLHEILRDPAVDHALRGDPALIGNAIEESLRLTPPLLFVARACVQDTTIEGTPIAAGTRVISGNASANRDERVFDGPDEFRADRENADQHLTFGFGAHVCPGASLARVETRLAIEGFFERFPAGSVRIADGYEFENVPTFFEIGPTRLPIVIA